ncbi:MAG: hypothetical protein ACYDA4_00005, partial [Ignavibacteriaceae bacterium]
MAGTDDLGRTLPQNNTVGNPKSNKHVALFYFLAKDGGVSLPNWVLSDVVRNHPEILNDYQSKYWGTNGAYYWGEPIYGYYRDDDYWVSLKNIQLLTDAGVDLLVIDATNTFTYPKQSNVLMNA